MNRIIVALVVFACAAAPAHAATALEQLIESVGGSAADASSSPKVPAAPLAPEAPPPLPRDFHVEIRGDAFVLVHAGREFGKVTARRLKRAGEFVYTSATGACLAMAVLVKRPGLARLDVTDCRARPLGVIKEDYFASTKVVTAFSLFDPGGRPSAASGKTDWISDVLELRTPSGAPALELRLRRLDFFNDRWSASVGPDGGVDSRLLVVLTAYKAETDRSRRVAQSAAAL